MQMLATEAYYPSWTPLEFMPKLSSSVLWIGPTVIEFSYCAQKEVISYVQNWELPWLLKIGMRGLWKKGHPTPAAIFYLSRFWWFHIEIDFYYWPRNDSQDDNALSIQCYCTSWRFVEIFSPSFLLPARAVFQCSTLFMELVKFLWARC